MKLGLGLYRHMLNDEYYAFAVQAGCTHVIVHLVDYFRQGEANPAQNQPTGGKDKPWGVAGDPNRLWTAAELIQLRKQVEAAGLKLEGIENLDPAHWYDILLDGPKRAQHMQQRARHSARHGRGRHSYAAATTSPSPVSPAASAGPSRAAERNPSAWMAPSTRPSPTAKSGT